MVCNNVLGHEYKVYNANQKCSDTEHEGTNRLSQGSAVNIPNPTLNQKVEGCRNQCETTQDCNFFFLQNGHNGEANFCILYQSCDIMVANNKPGIIFKKHSIGNS